MAMNKGLMVVLMAATFLTALPATAADAPPATVEMKKEVEKIDNPYGLDALWKTGDFVAKGTLIILVIMSMGSWYNIVTKFYAAQEKMNRMELKAEEQAAAKKDAQDLSNLANQKNAELQNYINTVQTNLTKEFGDYKTIALSSITDAATKIAKQKGLNLLIDKSPSTTYATSVFVFIDSSFVDITDDVLAEMNRGHTTAAEPAKK